MILILSGRSLLDSSFRDLTYLSNCQGLLKCFRILASSLRYAQTHTITRDQFTGMDYRTSTYACCFYKTAKTVLLRSSLLYFDSLVNSSNRLLATDSRFTFFGVTNYLITTLEFQPQAETHSPLP